MISKEIINTLLQEAHQDLDFVEEALEGVEILDEKFILLVEYRKELKEEIEKLEKSLRRLDLLQAILKK